MRLIETLKRSVEIQLVQSDKTWGIGIFCMLPDYSVNLIFVKWGIGIRLKEREQ